MVYIRQLINRRNKVFLKDFIKYYIRTLKDTVAGNLQA